MKGPEAGALEKENCKVLGNNCTRAGSLHQMPWKKCGGKAGPQKKNTAWSHQSNVYCQCSNQLPHLKFNIGPWKVTTPKLKIVFQSIQKFRERTLKLRAGVDVPGSSSQVVCVCVLQSSRPMRTELATWLHQEPLVAFLAISLGIMPFDLLMYT